MPWLGFRQTDQVAALFSVGEPSAAIVFAHAGETRSRDVDELEAWLLFDIFERHKQRGSLEIVAKDEGGRGLALLLRRESKIGARCGCFDDVRLHRDFREFV